MDSRDVVGVIPTAGHVDSAGFGFVGFICTGCDDDHAAGRVYLL